MTPPPPDASVRLHLKCPDAEDFVERFAPNVTRGGIFLPTRDAREVGATIRFEITLLDDTVVFAGEGVVTWAKPKGMGVKFTTLDPATEPMLERLLSSARGRSSRAGKPRCRASPSGASAGARDGQCAVVDRTAHEAASGSRRDRLFGRVRRRRRRLDVNRPGARPHGLAAEPAKPATVAIAARAVAAPALDTATAAAAVVATGARAADRSASRLAATDERAHPCPRPARAQAGFASRRCSLAPPTRTSPVPTPPPGSPRSPARP